MVMKSTVASYLVCPASMFVFQFNLTSCSLQDIPGRDNWRRDRACFSAPPSCNPGVGSCYFLSSRGVSGNADHFTFELNVYIRAGISRDSSVRDRSGY